MAVHFNVTYEACASLFLILLMIVLATRRRLEGYQFKIFRFYFAICLINNIVDMTASVMIDHYETFPEWLHWILNGYYYVMQFIIPTVFLSYLYGRLTKHTPTLKKGYIVALIPALAGVVMVLTSYVTRFIYYFDAAGFHSGSLHAYLYINTAIYAVLGVIFAIIWHDNLRNKEFFYIMLMISVSAMPIFIQMFFPQYLLTGLGSALTIYIMYLSTESQMEYMDQVSGAFNREALTFKLSEMHRHGSKEDIYAKAMDNFKIVNEIYGMEGGNRMMQRLVNKLQAEFGTDMVFRYGGDTFVVIVEEEVKSNKDYDKIASIFRNPFSHNGLDVVLSACICLVHGENHDAKGVFSAIEYGIAQAKRRGKGQFFEVLKETVDTLERRVNIEQAIMAEIERGRFEVHYQPIYDLKRKKICSLEALARLNVEGYGYVSPEEFIGIAEKNGSIIQLGQIVVDEVCRFIRDENLIEKGIEFIEINLSVVQCMREKLYKDIQEVLDKYNIPTSMINLEITESAAAYSEERLLRNMARLSMRGISFSLDDYGSGYSNISYLVKMPFSIVKIDKFFLWGAVKKSSTRLILENTIKLFKEINKKIVVEGVETLEMAQMVDAMGADYIQGYFYSKPVSKDKVMDVVTRINKEAQK